MAVLAVAGLASALVCAAPPVQGDEEKKTRVYTNDDLELYEHLRSAPIPTPAPAREADRRAESPASPGRGEAYWRREAERLHDRLEELRQRAEDLAVRVEDRRGRPGVRPYSDPQIESWERRRKTILERVRDMESRFLDRARREGALPGWLR
jgi:hypothetical protein